MFQIVGFYVLQLQYHVQPAIGFHDDFKTWIIDLGALPAKPKINMLTTSHKSTHDKR